MFRFVPAALAACLLLSFPRPAQADNDPRAVAVAEELMETMGGRALWEAKRYLTFDWAVESEGEVTTVIHHAWDRWTGDYRVDGTNREGEDYRVLFNINTRQGQAWKAGEALAGEELETYLTMGYGRFINDTYWVIMPWKWLDPGVNLAYEGEETLNGEVHDVVRLTFGDGIGLTSGDSYWGYVSRTTGLMTQWAFLLQDEEGNPGTGDRSVFLWENWQESQSGLKFSMRKPKVGDGPSLALVMPTVEASDTVPEGTFSPR